MAVTDGVDEPVEQLADLVVEERVLQRDAGLRRPGRGQLLGALVEGEHVADRSGASASGWPGSRFLLISWTTPITSPIAESIGTVSIERAR